MCHKFRIRVGISAAFLVALLAAGPLAATASDGNGADDGGDPLQGFNRGVFWFNEKLDRFLLEPVAMVWDALLPDPFERSVRNAFDNARFPVIFLNDLLQAKPVAAGEELARFLVNSTVGLGGLLDPASSMGLEGNPEDFGQTLGYWGVPSGPYLVLPLLGPSNPRDAVGLVADSAARVYPYFAPFLISTSIGGGDVVNRRSLLIEEIRESRAESIDFYAFQRSAYLQYRENLINDREDDDEETDEDLYYLDDE
jgi:phospholipid-binding lipoprotein MlaA